MIFVANGKAKQQSGEKKAVILTNKLQGKTITNGDMGKENTLGGHVKYMCLP